MNIKDIFEFLPLLLLFIGALIIVRGQRQYYTWTRGKTLEDYRKNHPDSVRGNRFCACHACGGGVLWIERYWNGARRSHLCKQCGVELWRSKA